MQKQNLEPTNSLRWNILLENHQDPEKIIAAIDEASERLNQSLNGIF